MAPFPNQRCSEEISVAGQGKGARETSTTFQLTYTGILTEVKELPESGYSRHNKFRTTDPPLL